MAGILYRFPLLLFSKLPIPLSIHPFSFVKSSFSGACYKIFFRLLGKLINIMICTHILPEEGKGLFQTGEKD